MDETAVYLSDREAAPDSAFVAGEPGLLVPGNHGRLLDARRTPIRVVEVVPERGAFVVRVEAFEDAGAHWELALDEIERFQFARDAARLRDDEADALRRRRAELARELVVTWDATTRRATRERLADRRDAVGRWLDGRAPGLDVDVPAHIERRSGSPVLYELLAGFAAERGFGELETAFAGTFVSNPRSGEIVKGHAIVLAELGLCAYRGPAPRDPDLFAGGRSRAKRAEHLLWRLAFTQELWRRLAPDTALYRAMASEGALEPRRPQSFVSATFSRAVAEEHFNGGPATGSAVLWRRPLPVERLVMTFVETAAMNARFHEAEAVLVADPGTHAF